MPVRGATINVDFLTAGQDWALPACLDARLSLSPDGPMFAGGDAGPAGPLHPEWRLPLGGPGRAGPLAPYIPSGAYL